jgi:hypothetical protein
LPVKKKETKSELSSEPTWDEIGKAVGMKIEKYKDEGKKMKFDCCSGHSFTNSCKGGGSAFYFLGFIGAAVYYISTATSFWTGVLGFLKALVWPAFLVFELLKFLGM